MNLLRSMNHTKLSFSSPQGAGLALFAVVFKMACRIFVALALTVMALINCQGEQIPGDPFPHDVDFTIAPQGESSFGANDGKIVWDITDPLRDPLAVFEVRLLGPGGGAYYYSCDWIAVNAFGTHFTPPEITGLKPGTYTMTVKFLGFGSPTACVDLAHVRYKATRTRTVVVNRVPQPPTDVRLSSTTAASGVDCSDGIAFLEEFDPNTGVILSNQTVANLRPGDQLVRGVYHDDGVEKSKLVSVFIGAGDKFCTPLTVSLPRIIDSPTTCGGSIMESTRARLTVDVTGPRFPGGYYTYEWIILGPEIDFTSQVTKYLPEFTTPVLSTFEAAKVYVKVTGPSGTYISKVKDLKVHSGFPQANSDIVSSTKVRRSDILVNDNNTIGATFSISPNSENGGTVSLEGDWIVLQPKPGIFGNDRWTYSLTSPCGYTSSATVDFIYVEDQGSGLSLNQLSPTSEAGGIRLNFIGIPGFRYRIEFKNSLGDPEWSVLVGVIGAGSNGLFSYVDSSGITPRYYRTVGY